MSNARNFPRDGRETARAETAASGPLTLGIDTASERRSVALLRGGSVLAERADDRRDGAASVLREIDEVLKAAGREVREVELFGGAAGPGSFTGLRAGLATLKALAVTLGRPAFGVPTLHALARAAGPARRLAALIPAGRGEVFAQFLSVAEGGEVRELSPPAHLPPAQLIEQAAQLGGGLLWVGAGAHRHAETIRGAARARGLAFVEGVGEAAEGLWTLAPVVESLAAEVARMAQARWRGGGAAAWAEELRALYVRPSDAELHEQCQQQS